MNIPNINTLLANQQLSSQRNLSADSEAHHNYADLGALDALKTKARADQASMLRPVAEQFEALFVQQILKESRKVSFDDNWLDGNQGDFYKDWYDKQLALNLSAKGTLGFADTIVEQLSSRIPATDEVMVESKEESDIQSNSKGRQVEKITDNNTPLPSTEQALALRFAQP